MNFHDSSVSRYKTWVLNVSYGKKNSSQKNAIDFFMRNFNRWFRGNEKLVKMVESYTGKSFGVKSPRRSLIKWLVQLVNEGIVITYKNNNGERYYRHSIYQPNIRDQEPYIDEISSQSSESEEEKESEISSSDEEKEEKTLLENPNSKTKNIRVEIRDDESPILIFEFNKLYKKKFSKKEEVEMENIRNIELEKIKRDIEEENFIFDCDEKYEEYEDSVNIFIGVFSKLLFTFFLSFFLIQNKVFMRI